MSQEILRLEKRIFQTISMHVEREGSGSKATLFNEGKDIDVLRQKGTSNSRGLFFPSYLVFLS